MNNGWQKMFIVIISVGKEKNIICINPWCTTHFGNDQAVISTRFASITCTQETFRQENTCIEEPLKVCDIERWCILSDGV